jgi:hypothetical protein
VTKETPKRKRFSLMVRKQAWVPTPLGWIFLAVCTVGLAAVLIRQSCAFLSYHRPIQADTLIIEGWVPDYVPTQTA